MRTKISTVLLALVIVITISNFCYGKQSDTRHITYKGETYWLWIEMAVGFEHFNFKNVVNRITKTVIGLNYTEWKEDSYEWNDEWEKGSAGDKDAARIAFMYNLTRNEVIFISVNYLRQGNDFQLTPGGPSFSSGGGPYCEWKSIYQDDKNYYEGKMRSDGESIRVFAKSWPGQPMIMAKGDKNGKVFFKFTTK